MLIFLAIICSPVIALCFLPLKKKTRGLFYFFSIIIATASILLAFKCEINTKYAIDSLSFIIIIDKFSKIFLILITCSWLISIIYSYEYTKYNFQEKKTDFFIYLNILLTVVMINACAGNLITLFIFYVIGIPLTHPLIKLRGNKIAINSAKKFFGQTFIPSFFIFLPAIFIVNSLIGHVAFDGTSTLGSSNVNPMLGGFLLLLFIVGISKNSVFPFHTWLPSTNTAPAPISALIHSVAAVKTGSIALIKIAVYIFGLEYIHILTTNFLTGGWLIYLCGITAIYTAYKALKTDDLKQRFAYSTVGQLSYIILAVLIGSKTGILAATLHIVTHSIAKSCLFYVAGFYNSIYLTRSVKEISEIIPSTRFLAMVIAICGLSISGFPFLAGYYSKDLMFIEEWYTHYYASAIFLLIGSVINLLYIIGPVKSAFKPANPKIHVKPIPFSMLLTFIISIALILGSNYYVSFIKILMH
jgi:multicomponent Na+:H+ antiporter subunit D